MEKIIELYMSNAITEESLTQWLQGNSSSNADSETSNSDLANLSQMAVNTFVYQFIDNLHQSFEWLIKQTSNVPLNRSKTATVVNSFIDENKITLNINDHESFPTLGEADKMQTIPSKVLTKRIKPTLVSQNRTPLNDNNSFQNISYGKSKAKTSDYFKEEREMLKNFKQNMTTTTNVNNTNNFSTNIKMLDVKKFIVIEPKYDLVSNAEEIIKLKKLYVHLLMNNHIASLLDEVKFILETINKRTCIDSAPKDKSPINTATPTKFESIFSSYHNCFYFVYLTFEDIFIDNLFINFLDYKAVNHILSNSYLIEFCKNASPTMKESIERTYLGRFSDSTPRSASENNFVFFQPDTDSKSNFPNDQSFSMFRKQRDEFYRILKNYHENNWAASVSTDRKVQSMFVSSIRSMLSMSKDVGNCYHLARLFVSQLLKSCHNHSDSKKAITNNRTSGSTNRILSDQDKFKKLQDRFVKRTVPNDNHLSSNLLDESFSQKERFFRDFIYYIDSHSFNEQLKLILKDQIMLLTTSDLYNFVDNDIEDSECDNSLLAHMSRLNLLAKFLGFLCFYPLDTSLNNEKRNEKNEFLLQQTSLRSLSGNQPPILDIETYLVNSMENHILVVAVPWVVEFLIFVDQITLSMSYYENVLSLLCLIYKYYLPNLTLLTNEYNSQVSYTRLFIQLFLEKLFAIKKFNASARLQTLVAANIQSRADVSSQMFHKVKNQATTLLGLNDQVYLDFHNDIFDMTVIATFFPHFSRLIVDLFKQFSNEVRKITPTAVSSSKQVLDRNDIFTTINSTTNVKSAIQTQAEECFLNIHSNSLKKCIHFLNDRISATCIKRIKCDIYPKAKTKHFETFLLDNPELKSKVINDSDVKKNIDLTTKLSESIRNECKQFVPEYGENKIKIIFPLIIVDDLDDSVINFAIKICLRHIEQRCGSWIELNITNETVYTDLCAFIKSQLAPSVSSKSLQSDSASVTHQSIAAIYDNFENVVFELRETLHNVNLRNFDLLDNSKIIKLLSQVRSVRKLSFLPASNTKLFDQITLDLAISIIACRPQMMTDELLDSFIFLWSNQKVTYQRVICAKTLHMLNKSQTTISTWLKFEFLLTRMLKLAVINFADIEEDIFVVVKQDWPDNVLTKFASLLKSLVECAKQHDLITFDEEGHSSHEILEWLSCFCAEKNI